MCVCSFNPTQISRTMGSHFTFISHHYGTLLAQSPLVAICDRPNTGGLVVQPSKTGAAIAMAAPWLPRSE
jgi:hypothetical protein